MAAGGSVSFPGGGAGAGTARRAWYVQVLMRLRSLLLGIEGMLATPAGLSAALRACAFALGVFMIVHPTIVFFQFLAGDTLLVSPPLILMFLAGFVGLGLSRPQLAVEENPNEAEKRGEEVP